MKKSGIILGIFLALNCIIGIANADVYWHFGDISNQDYVVDIGGPITSFVIPATMVVTEEDLPVGYFSGASAYATYNGVANGNGDGWTFGFRFVYPIEVYINYNRVSGYIPIGTYHWEIYGFSGEQDPWIMPDGVYQSVKLYCTLNHLTGDGVTTQYTLTEFHSLNDFKVTVGSVSAPEPTTMLLLGLGLVGLAGLRRKL